MAVDEGKTNYIAFCRGMGAMEGKWLSTTDVFYTSLFVIVLLLTIEVDVRAKSDNSCRY